MNYKKIYDQLIAKAQAENRKKLPKTDPNYVYYEAHHIVPKCMNGSNDASNIVNLMAREHYIAHILLYKHYKSVNDKNAYIKMSYALGRLMTGNAEFITQLDYHYNSRLYESIVSNRHLSDETKQKIGNANRGRIVSNETRNKLSIASKAYCSKHINGFYGKHHTDASKKKISRPGKLSAWYGRHHTAKTKRKLSETRLNNPKCRGKNIGRKPGFHFSLETKIKQFYIVHSKQYPNVDWKNFNFKEYYSIVDNVTYKQKARRRKYILDYIETLNKNMI